MVGETVVFTDKSNENPLVWEWGFSPATVQYVNGTDKNSQNPQIQFLSAGKYTVLLKAGNSKGDSIHVKLNYINVQPVGITAIYKETLRVYPNPSNGKFTIEIPGNFASESNSIQIMDVAGKVVFMENGLANNTIALNGIPKGIYFIKLITAQGLFTEKIVVQ
jgi:PKD repeat protein